MTTIHLLLPAACVAALAGSPLAAPPPGSELYCIRDVRVADREDAPRVSLVVSDGRIERVLDAGSPVPWGARVIEGEGYLALPAFIDAHTYAGCETPEPTIDRDVPTDIAADVDIGMRTANRKGIQPSFRAVDAFTLEEKDAEAWRGQGFGAMVSSPHGELLSGVSCVVTTSDEAIRDRIVSSEALGCAAFAASGSGYPSTLMAYVAQLRQFFLDARRHMQLGLRYEQKRPGPRPPHDVDLEAAVSFLSGERRIVCHADTARDIERWIELGAEAGFDVAITGGREAWKVAEILAARRVPVFLTLDWGEEVDDPTPDDEEEGDTEGEEGEAEEHAPESRPTESEEGDEAEDEGDDEAEESDWIYEEPLGVRERRRELWEQGRDCALRLQEAGVTFAFGSAGGSAKKLMKKVRTLVELGLPADAATKALTRSAADLCGVGERLGAVAPSFDATFALWTANPLTDDGKLAYLFVDGIPFEFDIDADEEQTDPPDDGVDATGQWEMVASGPRENEMTLELEMDDEGLVSGTLTGESPDGEATTSDVEGHVSASTLTLKGEFAFGRMNVEFTLTGEIDGDSFDGKMKAKSAFGDFDSQVSGTRDPERSSR